jgi:hypothetical protein
MKPSWWRLCFVADATEAIRLLKLIIIVRRSFSLDEIRCTGASWLWLLHEPRESNFWAIHVSPANWNLKVGSRYEYYFGNTVPQSFRLNLIETVFDTGNVSRSRFSRQDEFLHLKQIQHRSKQNTKRLVRYDKSGGLWSFTSGKVLLSQRGHVIPTYNRETLVVRMPGIGTLNDLSITRTEPQ